MVRRAVAVVRGTLPRLRPVSIQLDKTRVSGLGRTTVHCSSVVAQAWRGGVVSERRVVVRGSSIANQGGLISAATVTTLATSIATRHYVTAAPHGLPVPRPRRAGSCA